MLINESKKTWINGKTPCVHGQKQEALSKPEKTAPTPSPRRGAVARPPGSPEDAALASSPPTVQGAFLRSSRETRSGPDAQRPAHGKTHEACHALGVLARTASSLAWREECYYSKAQEEK